MEIDLLLAEIGSTTTVVTGVDGINSLKPAIVGQGLAPTTVLAGDVMIGLKNAINNLKDKLKLDNLKWKEFMATSSAAGGLKMTVHGLVKDMTVKAAKEAALGAGAVIKMVTAGRLRDYKLEKIIDIKPNIVLLAGGVDFGEEEVIIHNAEQLSKLDMDIPFIYAGNRAIQKEIEDIFRKEGKDILITENVYPEIDSLNVGPTRKLIHDVFARHIVRAPGMEKIKTMLSIDMMPTPGAVMQAAKLLKSTIGNLMVIDIGGATTDVHSVTNDTNKIGQILVNPEPEAKRTVEGDLGVYLNATHVYSLLKDEVEVQELKDLAPLPRSQEEANYIHMLAEKAAITAVNRHAGRLKDYYGPSGRQTVAEGKDLTGVKWIIGTGGALTRMARGEEILNKIKDKGGRSLLPTSEARVLIDKKYIMAVTGLMSRKYPDAALYLLKDSLGIN